uniref:Uncharacterized protein n=1 Tax=Arundo donax TaxID=35708 RepID=A0A0A9AXS1_ARUDO
MAILLLTDHCRSAVLTSHHYSCNQSKILLIFNFYLRYKAREHDLQMIIHITSKPFATHS